MSITDQDWGQDSHKGMFLKCGVSTGSTALRAAGNIVPKGVLSLGNSPLTICFWVFIVNDGSPPSDTGILFGVGDNGTNGFDIKYDDGGTNLGAKTFGISIGGSTLAFLGTPHHTDGQWTHVAMRFPDPEQPINGTIIINGNIEQEWGYDSGNSDSMTGVTFTDSLGTFVLGAEGTMTEKCSTPSNCYLKHVRIYNRLLSLKEIKQLYLLRI